MKFLRGLLFALMSLSCAAQLTPTQRAQIDSVFSDVAKPNSPGCALAVYQNGRILYEHGYGLASIEQQVPITPRTVFDLGSTSKQFTAFSILLLERDGKLALSDDVRKYIPELPHYDGTITIADLLHHTSGLRDYLTLWNLAGVPTENLTTDEDALKLILRQKQSNFPASSEFLYSNSGYFLLSEIVKRASGKTLRQFAQERIFTPLGMTHTLYVDDHTLIVPRRAIGYTPSRSGFGVEMSDYEQTGDGAVNSSIEDLLLWNNNFYAPKVGDAALIQHEHEPGKLASGEALDYAAGLFLGSYRGLKTVRHGGAWAGYRAELLRFPEQKVGIACLCNRTDAAPDHRAEEVADVVLDRSLAPKAPAETPKPVKVLETDLDHFSGVYANDATGELRRFTIRDGKLLIGGSRALVPAGADAFELPNSRVRVVFGGADDMRIVPPTAKPQVFHRFAPAPARDLTAYAGSYYCDELDTTFRVQVDDHELALIPKFGRGIRLLHAGGDTFMTDFGIRVTFAEHNGSIDSATMGAGRVRNLTLTRTPNSPAKGQ
jgi:CubicO group peptidase (beta-lactamase class C family)